jgi:Flp pilus assembly protein TadD
MSNVTNLFNVALHNHQAGNLRQAEWLYRQIIQTDPRHADCLHLLGVLAFQRGDLTQAVELIRKALDLNPNAGVYLSNLGLAYQSLGQIDDAVDSFRQAVRCSPDIPETHNNLATALIQQDKLAEAESHCRLAIGLRAGYSDAHNNLGNALLLQNRLDESLSTLERAIELNANNAGAHNNLGVVLQRIGRLHEAVAEGEKALQLQPDHPQAHNNLGMAYRLQGCWPEAEKQFQRAIQLQPSYLEACFNLALVRLTLGDFDQGWKDYELRWTQSRTNSSAVDPNDQTKGHRDFQQPLWDGEDLNGKTILIHAEQGLGDTIQFARYLRFLRRFGGKVFLECQKELEPLLACTPSITPLVAKGSELPAFDVQAPLLSLPRIFHSVIETIPAEVPYLHANTKLVDHWNGAKCHVRSAVKNAECSDSPSAAHSSSTSYFTSCTPRLRIGVAWQGNPGFLHDKLRSIPFSNFHRLAEIAGVQLVSLQKGPGVEQLRNGEQKPDRPSAVLVPLLDEASAPFMDTAALMMNLDLVITSDTVVAHLAGALGIPVWVVLALSPDWRWFLAREDSPWYPSMRLFRQIQQGQWECVFHRLAQELQSILTRAGNETDTR